MYSYQKISIDILKGTLETAGDDYKCEFKIERNDKEIALWDIDLEDLKRWHKELGKMIKEIEEIKVRDNI